MVEQLPLVCIHSTNKRPERTDTMRRQAAEQLIADLVKQGIFTAQEATSEHVDDLVEATRFETDGYAIAHELDEEHGWECDLTLANALDAFSGILDRIYREVEKRWATENPHGPQFAEGDIVLLNGKPATVVGVSPYRPQCYHLTQGKMQPDSYYVVPFENVRAPAMAAA